MSPYQYINTFARFGRNKGYNPGLERINALLAAYGHPENKIKTIHVAGTNGKGSTITYLKNIYQEAGYKVGVYTSPHLIDFNERIEVNGQKISTEKLEKLVEMIKPPVEELKGKGIEPSFFELVTALAFLYFYQEEVDLLILETGLGGRLDATNIIKKPLVSVITGISLEHTAILGNTIEEIAREKAGIIKEKTPVVTGVQDRAALAEIEKISKEKNCSFININEKYTYELKESTLEGQTFSLKHRGKGVEASQQEFIPEGEYRTKMIGGFQVRNAVLALEVVRLLQEEFPVKEEALRQGLLKAYLPGRLDILRKNPLLLVDGAHNSEGMENLVSSILSLKEAGVLNKQGRLYLVLAMLDDKDLSMILKHLKPLGEFNLIISENSNERVLSANIIKKEAALTGFKGKIIKPLAEAVKRTLEDARAEDLICVLGSLYNVAEVKAALE
ncbi:MAG TPA: bifunctional folylpolyglutamate synthase/dihydrofolate synthase [Halanaerobiaceae bacterium]|jgi:dihydrofolate synthase/folylpolyglutamate synthase|nr:folylpolyglutamate synthase/dihydrofolate synthase family protein [Bacillota bacterium]HHU92543.1 bifunctional folylpolyglutamate synthase/dihydrofolate synthase [Halanaerobiaceae bacterium]HOA41672.1 folylpolyglutamate synthase/dihydrofolate synthase family protein [Halanaerobiales bacterium]HPZ63817.1 folylpolyglutamate synthase/dihydrofolate synthase family protein [Halanaerobiales bacterium]HQD05016.1 folylpolyglutamate synthase/dihydrofolate synthase family protein [Halanaerobiales bact